MSTRAQCLLCKEFFSIADITDHLKTKHAEDPAPLTWPDGEPVVFDDTLEPEDFHETP